MNNVGRKRGYRFSDRPKNLEITTRSGVTHFRYVFPDGARKVIGSSKDRADAYAKAEALNGYFASQRTSIADLIVPRIRIATPRNPALPTLITEFRRHDPKRKKLATSTLTEQDYKLEQYARLWPIKTVQDFDTADLAEFLNGLTDNAYVKHRALLLHLFQFAGHQGYVKVNPMAVTLEKGEADKVRQRHTWEGYKAILDAAPDWMNRAMRIGLYSLQRRGDVVLLNRHINKVDLDAGTITILQHKTRNYKHPVYIEIEMGEPLYKAVEDCIRSPIPCPYLIHRRPTRMTVEARKSKAHPFAVTPGYLTREFSKLRDRVGAYANMKPAERPTFHELRSFGSWLYEQGGYSREYIMAQSGHAKESTLEGYIKDHAGTAPKRVSAGLSTGQLPA